MKIVTWNINGVRARIGNLLHWLSESAAEFGMAVASPAD